MTQRQRAEAAHGSAFQRAPIGNAWLRYCSSAHCSKAPLLMQDKSGVAAIEYALLCALLAVAIVAGITQVGSDVNQGYTYVEEEVAKATGAEGRNYKTNGKGSNGNGNGKSKAK